MTDFKRENEELRRMLCLAYAVRPYTDDGELQDNSCGPMLSIDFKRDKIEKIQKTMMLRGIKNLKGVSDGACNAVSIFLKEDVLRVCTEFIENSVEQKQHKIGFDAEDIYFSCIYCGEENDHIITHEKECPTIMARRLIKECKK